MEKKLQKKVLEPHCRLASIQTAFSSDSLSMQRRAFGRGALPGKVSCDVICQQSLYVSSSPMSPHFGEPP